MSFTFVAFYLQILRWFKLSLDTKFMPDLYLLDMEKIGEYVTSTGLEKSCISLGHFRRYSQTFQLPFFKL